MAKPICIIDDVPNANINDKIVILNKVTIGQITARKLNLYEHL